MEKLNTKVVALSAGIASAIVDIICLILIAVLPFDAMIKGTNALMHGIDISSIAVKKIAFAASIGGIIGWFVFGALIGYIFAVVYNLIIEKI